MKYLVMIRRTDTGFSVDVPDLPGCVATGSSVERAKSNISKAIEMHLELMQQAGEEPPPPTQSIEFSIGDDAEEEMCTWVEVERTQAVA